MRQNVISEIFPTSLYHPQNNSHILFGRSVIQLVGLFGVYLFVPFYSMPQHLRYLKKYFSDQPYTKQ